MKTKTETKNITWTDVCRQNTGKALCDSGGENGRHWQQPLPALATWLNGSKYSNYFYQVISLHHFLDNFTTIDQKITKELREFANELYNDQPYVWNEFTTAQEYLETNGWIQAGQPDNTCSIENNLSQNFQFSKWTKNNKTIFCIHTHNGADTRGGYSDAVICTSDDEYWYHYCTDSNYYVIAGINIEEKNKLDAHDLEDVRDELEGAHYQFCQDIKILRLSKNKVYIEKDKFRYLIAPSLFY